VTDLQRERAVAASVAIDPAAVTAPPAVIEKVRRVLTDFLRRAGDDGALRAFAAGKDTTLHFVLPDVGCDFYLRMRGGGFEGALGPAADGADVELGMPAEVLDGMFTGTLDAMQAAAGGKISFAGDAMKAMTLQEIQGDLARCYQAARAAIGDPGL
jgi:autoinducer 2 (AI-2) kinase